MKLIRHLFCLSLFFLPFHAAYAVVPTEERPIAILRALDKITARVEEFEVSKNAPYHFGALSLVLRSCRETTPEETPEAAAFLQVVEKTIDDEVRPVFSGWMFASSPALSAMEHPVYDIWLMGCRDQKVEKAPPAAGEDAAE
ncbi:MAG: DUF2155 domain-containing protein [Bdellovibrionales bacterium]